MDLVDQEHPFFNLLPTTRSYTRSSSSTTCFNKGKGSIHDDTQKTIVHREIERHRRKEMTKLYASLRDLLPVEFIQGNRSVSDHMKHAVGYIKQMEENVKELKSKRGELKKFSKTNESSSTNGIPNRVSVRNCNGGVHILIDSCLF